MLRLAVAIAGLAFVFARVPLHAVGETLANTQVRWFTAALAVSLVVQCVGAVRLRCLTDVQHLGLSTWNLFEINLSTQFYGLALPGGNISGMAVRLSRLPGLARKLAAGVSLLADQVVAVGGMCTIGIAFWLVERPQGGLLTGAAIFTVLLCVILLLIALLSQIRSPVITTIRWPITRLGDKVHAVGGVLRRLGRLDRGTLLEIGLLAVVAHLLGVIVYCLLAQSLSMGVPFVTIGWIRSAMLIATLLPITVSGLGLREAASLLLLSAYDLPAEQIVAFSLLVVADSVLFGLLGGVLEVRRLWSLSGNRKRAV